MTLGMGAAFLISQTALYASFHVEERANVPFSFYVNNKIMPSGEYNVKRENNSLGVLLVQDSKADQGIFTTYNVYFPYTNFQNAKLVFHKYGDKYFLAQVWDPVLGEELQLPVTNAEKTARKAAEEMRTSQNISPQNISVAASYR